MRSWGDDIDPATIPDEVLRSERARRNALRRRSYSGGVYWEKHNPGASNCRCVICMQARQSKAAAATTLSTQPQQPPALSTVAPGPAIPRKPRAKLAAIALLPLQYGEHKTRQGQRAFVVRISEDPSWQFAAGFIEFERGKIYRLKKTWSQETGEVMLQRARRAAGFDLVERIDPRLTSAAAADWPKEHQALLERWEWAKD